MSKAEKFIEENTKDCSNLLYRDYIQGFDKTVYQPWLTPDQARMAVKIVSEEVIEKTVDWLTKHAKKYYFNKERYLGTDELIEDYKLMMSMQDE